VSPSIRIGVANVFNHVNWGAPVTGITANNFMKFTPGSADPVGVPGPRTVNIGFRLQF